MGSQAEINIFLALNLGSKNRTAFGSPRAMKKLAFLDQNNGFGLKVDNGTCSIAELHKVPGLMDLRTCREQLKMKFSSKFHLFRFLFSRVRARCGKITASDYYRLSSILQRLLEEKEELLKIEMSKVKLVEKEYDEKKKILEKLVKEEARKNEEKETK